MKKVLIIGAGAIGLHCAYYLKEMGHEVEVLDAREENDYSACSYGNCGFMVPSHFLTMASPAILKSGVHMLFQPNGPIAFNLLNNLQRMGWFMKFTAASLKKNKVKRAIPLLYDLNYKSNLLYKQFNWDNDYQSKGLLMVSSSHKGMIEELEVSKLGNELGIKTDVLNKEDLNKLEPDVEFDALGAVLYHSDAHLNPAKHMEALESWLKENGVVFHYGQSVSKIEVQKGKINAVFCGEDQFKADEYILAAGVESYHLAKHLAIKLPIISGKGYSMDFNQDLLKLKTPVILTDEKVAISPYENTVRIGSGMEFNGSIGKVNYKRVQGILDATHKVIPTFKKQNAQELDLWEGQRPLSADGVPFIGRTKKYSNLTIGAGHAMMGMSLAPITGQMIARIIQGEKQEISSPLLSPDRY